MKVELVEAKIPLLIGSNSLEAAKAKLCFEENIATFFDQEVKMHKVGSANF